jgi:hypothetical protein
MVHRRKFGTICLLQQLQTQENQLLFANTQQGGVFAACVLLLRSCAAGC